MKNLYFVMHFVKKAFSFYLSIKFSRDLYPNNKINSIKHKIYTWFLAVVWGQHTKELTTFYLLPKYYFRFISIVGYTSLFSIGFLLTTTIIRLLFSCLLGCLKSVLYVCLLFTYSGHKAIIFLSIKLLK